MSTTCGHPLGGTGRNGGHKPDFLVDVINERPLALITMADRVVETAALQGEALVMIT